MTTMTTNRNPNIITIPRARSRPVFPMQRTRAAQKGPEVMGILTNDEAYDIVSCRLAPSDERANDALLTLTHRANALSAAEHERDELGRLLLEEAKKSEIHGILRGPNGAELASEAIINSVPPGWAEIVKRLANDLRCLVVREDENGELPEWAPGWSWSGIVTQVKEKFGGLRFYIGGGSVLVFWIIEKAEEESLRTCQTCGKTGELVSVNGWWSTLCALCAGHAPEKRDADV